MISDEFTVSAVQLDTRKVHYVSMEGIRGIAAIWVAFRHTMPLVYPIRSQTNFLSVDIFFLLSGFVLSYSYEDKLLSSKIGFVEFCLMRLIRIYPLYLLGSVLGLILLCYDSSKSMNDVIVSSLKALCFLPTLNTRELFYPLDYPAWSLFFELLVSFLYAGVLIHCGSRVIGLLSGLSGLIFFYGTLRHGSADIGYQSDTFQYGFARIGFSFGLGILVFRLRDLVSRFCLRTNNIGTLIIFAVTSLSLMLPIRHNTSFGPWYDILALLVIFPIIISFATQNRPSGLGEKISIALGNISYPLYVFHVPISGLAIDLFRDAAGIKLANYAPMSGLLLFILLFVTAILSNELYDIPVRQLLKTRVQGMTHCSTPRTP